MGYYGANANHGIFADCYTTKDGTAGTDTGSAFNQGGFEFPLYVLGVRIAIVGKRDVGANTDVIFQRDAIPDLDAVLDSDVIANHGFVLNEAVRTDIAVLADLGAREDDAELPYVCRFRHLRLTIG